LVTAQTSQEQVTHAQLVERTKALLPVIAERAQHAEDERRLPDATIDDIAATGFFRVMVPKRYGGLELDVSAVTDVGRLLGRACASTGWVIPWLGWHNRFIAMFPESVQDEIFSRGYGLSAGSTTFTGEAQPASGGYVVNGKWSWGTGILHADWANVMALAPDKRPVSILARKDELVVEDNWFTEGMRATGSCDIKLKDAFIPADRVIDGADLANGKAPGQLINTGPLYHCPTRPIACLVATAAGIGIAEGVIEDFRSRVEGRELAYSGGKRQRDQQSAHIRLASLTADVHAAGMLFDAAVDHVAKSCRGEIEISMIQRAEVRLWAAHAIQMSRRAVAEVVAQSGARSHFMDDPLQRAMRDLNTLSGHVMFDYDRAAELYGRVSLGLELEPTALI
jgi:alkylation response protein AidB-like acyl-CoA dehydrogenase